MRRRLGSALSTAVLLAGMLLGASPALAANPAANLDQCANDPAPSPSNNGCDTSAAQWVNGNLGSSKSLYFEGDTIPYRMTLSNLVTGGSVQHSLTIEWDTTKGGKHAIDYIDTFNQSVTTANPCLGIAGCNPASFNARAIPSDPQVTGAVPTVTPIPGDIRIYGGTISSLTRPQSVGSTSCTNANSSTFYCYSAGTGFSGDKSAAITINFTAAVPNPVIAWGGHIATRRDWGQGSSAGAVSGSPYHMRLIDLDGAGGNQDRSLSADAVILPATITIVKNTVPDSTASFGFSDTGGLTPATFSLVDDGINASLRSRTFNIQSSFTTYTFTEGTAANYTLSFVAPVCVITSPNSSSFSSDATTRTLTINLHEGENYTCTFTNTHFNNTPTVGTQVKSVGVDGVPGNNDDQNVANNGHVGIGSVVYDTASLSGAASPAGGSMQYYVEKGDAACTIDANSVSLGSKTVTNGVALRSDTYTFTSAGTYYFWAVYSGDTNNDGNTSGCSTEIVVVNQTQSSTTTAIHDATSGNTLGDPATVSINQTIYDTNSVTGSSPTGNVTYYYRKQTAADLTPNCSSGTQIGAVKSVGIQSDNFSFSGAGTYEVWAVYAGDSNNIGSNSVCGTETVVVGQSQSQTTTQVKKPGTPPTNVADGGHISIGQSIFDTNSVTGSSPTGNVTYYYELQSGTTADCASGTQLGAVKSVGVDSDTTSFSAAGTYELWAVYAGDANNATSTSTCGSETVVVDPNTNTLTTQVKTTGADGVIGGGDDQNVANGGSVGIGTEVYDTSTIGNPTSNAGGTVTYYVEKGDSLCTVTGATSLGSKSVTSGGTLPSDEYTFATAGTYYFWAVYSGDGNNVGATSGCSTELVVVDKNGTTTNTQVKKTTGDSAVADGGHIGIGVSIYDTATVAGGSNAGGTVTYWFQQQTAADVNPNCTAGTQIGTSKTVTNGVGAASDGTSFAHAGTYELWAVYSGDENNLGSTSVCSTETVVVDKTQSSTTTQVKLASDNSDVADGGHIAIGQLIYDTNAVTGTSPTGTVTYYAELQSGSTPDCSGGTQIGAAKSVGVSSDNTSFSVAGTYELWAVYGGDSDNLGSSSLCGSETVVVDKNTTTTSTQVKTGDPATDVADGGHIAINQVIWDTTTLGNPTTDAGGTVDYYYQLQTVDDSSPNCTGGTHISQATVTGGSAGASDSLSFSAAGTYELWAVYSGDSNNKGSSSTCGSETVVVDKNSPSSSTQVKTGDPATDVADGGHIAIDQVIWDTSSLTGATTTAGGTVDYYYQLQTAEDLLPNCTAGTHISQASVTGAAPGDSDPVSFSSAGTYELWAVYSGDANNNGATSTCGLETVIVDKHSPQVVTTPNLLPNDDVEISNLAGPGAGGYGNLIVELKQGTSCATGTLLYSRTFTPTDAANKFTGNGTYHTDNKTVFVTDDATIRWCTTYTGDANNAAFGPDDTGEVISIDFNPAVVAGFAFGFAFPLLGWFGLRLRRRGSEED